MGFINPSQEIYGRILNHIFIEEHNQTQLNISEEYLWRLKSVTKQ